MEILLVTLGAILLLAGVAFSILPPLPGPVIAWGALLLLLWHDGVEPLTTQFLIIWGAVALASTFMDNVLTVWGTKMSGGSKAGAWGSMVGLIAGMLFLAPFLGPLAPFAIIIGPFAGAVLFEMASGQAFGKALKAGLGSFMGFLAGTLLKVGVSVAIGIVWIRKLV